MKLKPSHLLAGAIALAGLLWILSGQIWPSGSEGAQATSAATDNPAGDPATTPVAAPEDLPQVRVRTQTAQAFSAAIQLRGETEAERVVQIRAETSGQVEEVLVDKGQWVAAEAIILKIDDADRQARLAQARALLKQRQIEYDAAKTLADKGYRSETAVAEAAANLEVARSAVTSMEVEISYTRITAPFEGQIDDRMVEIGDFVEIGEPMALIVDSDPIIVVGQISERYVGAVEIGDAATVTLADGHRAEGQLRYVARVGDSATRTFRIEVALANADGRILEGQSGEIALPLSSVEAHLVSPAILSLSENGDIGVKIVNQENRIEFRKVDILAETVDGIWLGGLPATATFVTVGQEFVKDGVLVEPIDEADAQAVTGTP